MVQNLETPNDSVHSYVFFGPENIGVIQHTML